MTKAEEYKKWISGVFDRSAAEYGTGGASYFHYFAEGLVNSVPLKSGDHVLDLATGRGFILKRALKRVEDKGTVIGVDISLKMIEELKKELAAENISNAKVICGDAEELNFTEGTFDCILCGFGLFFFPNPEQTLQKLKSMLKPGGYLGASFWGPRDTCHDVLKDRLKHFGLETKVVAAKLDSKEAIEALFLKAGFDIPFLHHAEYEQQNSSVDKWFAGLWHHGTRGLIENLTEVQLDDLKASVSHLSTAKGFPEKLIAYYAVAKK